LIKKSLLSPSLLNPDMKKSILLFCLVFLWHFALADNFLVDPITGKSLEYHQTGIDGENTVLNPLSDIGLEYCVFKKQTILSQKVKSYIQSRLTDPEFTRKFQLHKDQVLTKFIGNTEVGEISRHDQALIRNQSVSLYKIYCVPLYYYNNLVCIRVESRYIINESFRELKQDIKMVYSIFIDVGNGSISTFEKMCPPSQRIRFISALSKQRNKTILALGLNSNRRLLGEESNEEAIDSILPNQFKDLVTLSDLMYDAISKRFIVPVNSGNTQYTFGSGFNFPIPEDSISYFLPFVKKNRVESEFKAEMSESVNFYLKRYTFTIPEFIEDRFLRQQFNDSKKTSRVLIFNRHLRASDTSFKLVYIFNYNKFNQPESIVSMIGSDKEECIFTYDRERRLIRYHTLGATDYDKDFTISYNKDGLIKGIIGLSNDIEKWYSFQKLKVLEFVSQDGNIENNTFEFDSSGNFLSRFETGKKPSYTSIYVGKRLMAESYADALYSYNDNNLIDSKRWDNDQYFTKYFYNSSNNIIKIDSYRDGKMNSDNLVECDELNRISRIRRKNYSYGRFENESEYKIEYQP